MRGRFILYPKYFFLHKDKPNELSSPDGIYFCLDNKKPIIKYKEDIELSGIKYQLIAILIHEKYKGSDLMGHFYSYIKNLATGAWWKMDDSSASKIEGKIEEEIYKDEGEKIGTPCEPFPHLIFYKRIDNNKKSHPDLIEDFLCREEMIRSTFDPEGKTFFKDYHDMRASCRKTLEKMSSKADISKKFKEDLKKHFKYFMQYIKAKENKNKIKNIGKEKSLLK